MPNALAAQHQIFAPTVIVKAVEGEAGIEYSPVNQAAFHFRNLIGTTFIPEWSLTEIRRLGFNIEFKR
jgi:hypothetical protein